MSPSKDSVAAEAAEVVSTIADKIEKILMFKSPFEGTNTTTSKQHAKRHAADPTEL
jgi:hypothetical protein